MGGARPWLLVVAAALFGLAACAPSAGPPAANPPPASAPAGTTGAAPAPPATEVAVETISLGYPAPSLSWLPAMIAERKGFYADERLSPQFIQMVPTNIVAGLLAGELDFSLELTSSAQATVQQGAPLRNLMAIAVKPQHRLMVQADVRTFADLRGRTVAINQRLDFTDWETRVVLERNGLQPDDVNLLAIPSSGARLAGLDSGQIAGAIMASPFDLQAEAHGYHELGRISRELDIVWIGLSAPQRTIQQRPDTVVRTLRATIRGLEYTRANRDEAIRGLQDWLNMEPEVAAASYDLGLETWSADGTASDEAWRNTLEISRLAAPLPNDVTLAQYVDKAPLEEARRSLAARR
jgi:NitT/TauT family transport system substrate-binding protein